jgi:hypothetical protein
MKKNAFLLSFLIITIGCASHTKLWCTKYLFRIQSVSDKSFFVKIDKCDFRYPLSGKDGNTTFNCDSLDALLSSKERSKYLSRFNYNEQYLNIRGCNFIVSDTNLLKIDSTLFHEKLNAIEVWYSIRGVGEVGITAQIKSGDAKLIFSRKILVDQNSQIHQR